MSACTLTPMFWQGSALVSASPLAPLDAAAEGTLTILHTNDLHASIDARPGSQFGGVARIASTIEAARAAGPVLVVDAGDSVFGGGTWWCARDAGATSRLLTHAGYDLAALGNHDLEHGVHSVRELLDNGRRLVASNLEFEVDDLRTRIPPAYVVSTDSLRIGVLGLTTRMTLMLVPSGLLQGVEFIDTLDATARTVAALSPFVHSIVIVSHLGFDHEAESDVQLIIPALRGSKVSTVLGGHTHEALDPAYVIDGIVACNAGSYGVNVNKVTLTRRASGSVAVRAKLLPQDASVAESERFLAARQREWDAFAELRQECAQVPPLPSVAARMPPLGRSKEREMSLLTAALRATVQADAKGIQMVAHLYVIGHLPEGAMVSRLDTMTAYPNAERLVEVELAGRDLKRLVALQPTLSFHFAALPVWIGSGTEVSVDDLDDARTYCVVMSELAAEGGLGWTIIRDMHAPVRPLGVTCAELVWDYLAKVPSVR